jgi:type I restriction enzyme S subunit
MSFAKYPEYRDSGIAWLGEVPVGWNVKRIKDTTYLKGRVGWKGLSSDEYLTDGYAYLITGTDFRKKYISLTDCYHVDRERYQDDPYIQLREGDLLITKDGTIGKLALVCSLDKPACLNSGIFLVRPISDYITEFMYWVLNSSCFKIFCDLSSQGSTIQHLYQNVFEDFTFPSPTTDEQIKITRFLDHETAKIDALIQEQERLTELLKEKRQAVISNAVTKGLDPMVKMKDSGIEWLGEVPEHWTLHKIKSLTSRISSGKTPNGGSEVYVDDGIIFLRSQNVYDEGLRLDEVVYIPEMVDLQMVTSRVQPGDILLNITGGSIGRSCSVPENFPNANVNQHVCVIRLVNPELLPFVEIFFKSFAIKSQIEFVQNGAAREGLNFEQIGSMRLCLPPLTEQCEVVDQVTKDLERYSSLIAEAQLSVSLLQERRMALVSSAVTGQIDVRNFHAI